MPTILRLAHLYPEHMNIYGDRGNIITLRERCQRRGITLEVEPIIVGQKVDWARFDLAFFGGGQDSGQSLIAEDFLKLQGDAVGKAAEDGLVILSICGGYQLLGHYFLTHDGQRLPGLGLLDVHTVGGKKRLIGNLVAELEPMADQDWTDSPSRLIVGFENHSGRTYHGKGVLPLARVRSGHGDNGEDKLCGAYYRNVFGCYLHGSLLPKNPHIADELLRRALQRRGETIALPSLQDDLEWHAHETMTQRMLDTRPQRWSIAGIAERVMDALS